MRVGGAQLFAGAGEELLRERGSGLPAAFRVSLDGGGVAVLLGADYPVHAGFWRDLLALAGARPRLELNADRPGVVAVPVATGDEAALVAVNVAPYDVTVAPEFDGAALGDGPLVLRARGHRILTLPAGAGAAPTTHRTETHA